jgi:type II secretory pathway pseudopilin PulG
MNENSPATFSHSAFGNRHSAFSPSSHSSFEFRHSGFTFIEVLFAVILLGIGFIMIAAVFPVAIQQTSAVSDETQGTAIARDAIKKIQALAEAQIVGYPSPAVGVTYSPFQSTLAGGIPSVQAFSPNILQALGSDSLFTGDRRFGWVGFYRRDSVTSPFAQIYIIALENPNFPNYVTKFQPGEATAITPAPPILPTVAPPIPPYLYNFAMPGPAYAAPIPMPGVPPVGISAAIQAEFYYNTDGTTNIIISYPSTQTSFNAITGAYALVASGNVNMTGRFFRLGTQLPATSIPSGYSPPGGTINPQIFQVQPGSDITPGDAQVNGFMPSATTAAFTATIFMMGAAPLVDTNGEFTGPFSGPNQDIGVATGFIRVNTTNN